MRCTPSSHSPIVISALLVALITALGCGADGTDNTISSPSDYDLCAAVLQPMLINHFNVKETTVEVSTSSACTLYAIHPDDTRRFWGLEVITAPGTAFRAAAEERRGTDDFIEEMGQAAYWDASQQRTVTIVNDRIVLLLDTRDEGQFLRLSEATAEDEFGGRWRREATRVSQDLAADPSKLQP